MVYGTGGRVMRRTLTSQIRPICAVSTDGPTNAHLSDNAPHSPSDGVQEFGDVELALLAATMRKHGAPADGVSATVRRLAVLRSAWRAGEITESVMDERADLMLRRLFARKPRTLVAVAGVRS